MADNPVETRAKPEATSYLVPPIIAKALIAVQRELEPLTKSSENDAFGSKYVPLDVVTERAHKLLTKYKIAVMQPMVTDEQGHSALETILIYEDGRSFSRTTKLAVSKVDPQAHGSAVTYTRRYALMAMIGLTAKDEDDDGNKATGVVVPVTDEQKARMKSLMTDLRRPPKDIQQELFNTKTRDHADLAIMNLEKLVSMRVRDEESKKNAAEAEAEGVGTKIDVTTGEILDDPIEPTSASGFKGRIKSLGLAGPDYERKVIHAATRAWKLDLVMKSEDKIASLDLFLKGLESGVHHLEPEFYALTDERRTVEVNVA